MHGGYQGPIECLPELMAACEGKEDVFASIVDSELQTLHISQVMLSYQVSLSVRLERKSSWEKKYSLPFSK